VPMATLPTDYDRIDKAFPSSVIPDAADATAPPRRCSGFTLIEVLAALAICSLIAVATAALIHTVARNFDRGTSGVDAADGLMLAVERLAADFGSARYVTWAVQGGPAVAFRGERADGEKPARLMFVSGAGIGSLSRADELVSLTIEQKDDVTRLVRRRATWTGPDMLIEHLSMQDAVVLIEGDLDMSFLFGRFAGGGGLVWSRTWIGETTLPRFVRLTMRDRATGADPVGEADFIVNADAPLACGRPDAGPDCLSRALPAEKRRAASAGNSG
jgi:prepilin-type N-terminal cleavage/methylation domain-containing protein